MTWLYLIVIVPRLCCTCSGNPCACNASCPCDGGPCSCQNAIKYWKPENGTTGCRWFASAFLPNLIDGTCLLAFPLLLVQLEEESFFPVHTPSPPLSHLHPCPLPFLPQPDSAAPTPVSLRLAFSLPFPNFSAPLPPTPTPNSLPPLSLPRFPKHLNNAR